MSGLRELEIRVADMALLALSMWRKTNEAFMEHDLEILSAVLKDENTLNDLEKELTAELVRLSRASADAKEKSFALVFANIVGDLELIGDYCKDILERVQIKIEEKLLFSEEAVEEYEGLYQRTEDALEEVARALKKNDFSSVPAVLKKEGHIDGLVDELRIRHNQRLVQGICSPISCNMFLNMLDFTAAVYYHTKKVARSLLQLS
jgi:phosphate:Na+ symporter